MGEAIKNTGNEAVKRWHAKMPKFFRWMIYACTFVAGLSLSVNTAITMGGGTPHEWWSDIYPYVLGIPAGIAFCAKFTCDGGYQELDPDKVMQGNISFDRDSQQPNMSDVETEQPNNENE